MGTKRLLRWALSCAALVACSNSSGTDDAGVDSGADVAPKKDSGPADVAADVPDDTGCNALVAPDAAVMEMFVATDPVVGDGGPWMAGTYTITAHTIYTGLDGSAGPTGSTFDVILVTDDAGAYEALQVQVADGGAPKVMDINGTVTILTGGAESIKVNCPVNAALIYTSYSFDGTNLSLYAPTYKPPQAMFLKKQ